MNAFTPDRRAALDTDADALLRAELAELLPRRRCPS